MRSGLAALLCVALLAPLPARAQQWVAGAGVGGTDHRTVSRDVGGTSAMLGLRREGERWLYLSAGLPVDTGGVPWGAVGAGGRLALGSGLPVSLGLDAAAHGFGYRDAALRAAGGGGTVEALPFVALQHGPLRLEAHSGARAYASSFEGNTFSRAVLDAGARLSFAPEPRLSLTGDARWVQAVEGGFPYAGAELAYADGRLNGWAYLGRWLVASIPAANWGAGASVDLAAGFRLEASVQQDATDPLYWNPTRRLWSVGLARGLGGARAGAAVPLPAPILPETRDGQVILRVAVAESPTAPSVAGDFNGWSPAPLRRVGDAWEIALALEPGVYHYGFRRADGSWFLPASVTQRVDDGFGGVNAVLVVPARPER